MTKPAGNPPATSMRSLERAIDVLEVLDGSRHALRLSEIARRAGLPVATTQRILGVLESRGRVERDASGYRPGVGLIFGAHAYLTSSPLITAARPVLQDLAAETGLTASLFRRVGWARVVLARVDGTRPLRYELPVGERLPLHLGAGKAIAAWLTPEEIDEFLAQADDLVGADGSALDHDQFRDDLKRIRDRGFSHAYGERVPGMASVAAPVIDPDGSVTAAVQVAGHQEDVPHERIDQLGVEVAARRLRHRPPRLLTVLTQNYDRPDRPPAPRGGNSSVVRSVLPAAARRAAHTERQHMIKGSDLFVAALANEGVDRVFGVPGEENLDMVESLRTSNIELVVTRHEQSAAFMAATHGRLTGRPGVCLSTLGPGALNLATGAAYAHLGAMPMILVTGQKPIRSSQQARFQIVDMVATMKPLTKLSRQIVSTSSIPTIVREAFRVATEERPGPVHLELPEDIAGEMGLAVPMVPPHTIALPVATATAVDSAVRMIRQAQRPLVMLGAAASRPRLGADLGEFLARTRIPFFTTQMGKGVVAGRPLQQPVDLWLGTAALSERDYVHEAIDRADLILAIGHDTVEKPPVPHGPGRTDGHPRRLHATQHRRGLLPARLRRRRHRPEPDPARRPAGRRPARTPRPSYRCATASCGTSRKEPTSTASRSCRNASSPTCGR